MGWFSSSTEKSAMASNPVNVDVTKQYGSAAEQDRYGQHFANAGTVAGEKIKQGINDLSAGRNAGSGAEQDRFGAKFGTGDRIAQEARSGFEHANDSAERGYDRARASAERGYNQAKGAVERGYDQAKDAAERGYDQVRYTAEQGYEKAKGALDHAIHAKGDGAEQDRYAAHFDYSSLDLAPVTKAALSIVKHGGDLSKASAHGLGHDGWQRAKLLAAYKGYGAEQDRYEARFGGAVQAANSAIKDKINELRR